jgi:hypothetical protein
MAISVEGPDVSELLGLSESSGHSESWDILSPVRHSLSARRHSRVAAENGALQLTAAMVSRFLKPSELQKLVNVLR